MSDFMVFLVENLGRRLPEAIQDYYYDNPDKLEELYGEERLEELRSEYLKTQEV